MPQDQTQLILPTSYSPTFVGLAYGVQNYTCSQANNFTNIGAVAELIDVSCLAGSSIFSSLPDQLYTSWSNASLPTIQDSIQVLQATNPPEILAQHYFVPNPTTGQGLSPKWDFSSSGKFHDNSDAYMIGKGKGSLAAPTDSATDINWLDVLKVDGSIADEVFRTDTKGGQPPSTCVFGQSQDISVKYVAFYWFFGGSLGNN